MQHKRQTNGFGSSVLWMGLAAGFVGGLVVSWTMIRFKDVWSKLAAGIENRTHNEFRDVWDELAEVGESFKAQASKPGRTPEVRAEV